MTITIKSSQIESALWVTTPKAQSNEEQTKPSLKGRISSILLSVFTAVPKKIASVVGDLFQNISRKRTYGTTSKTEIAERLIKDLTNQERDLDSEKEKLEAEKLEMKKCIQTIRTFLEGNSSNKKNQELLSSLNLLVENHKQAVEEKLKDEQNENLQIEQDGMHARSVEAAEKQEEIEFLFAIIESLQASKASVEAEQQKVQSRAARRHRDKTKKAADLAEKTRKLSELDTQINEAQKELNKKLDKQDKKAAA